MPVSSEQLPSAFSVHLRRTKQGHEAPVKQLSAGVSGVDMYDRIIITHWSASCHLNRMFFWRCDSNAFCFINRRFPTHSTCFSQPLVPVIWRSLLMPMLKQDDASSAVRLTFCQMGISYVTISPRWAGFKAADY